MDEDDPIEFSSSTTECKLTTQATATDLQHGVEKELDVVDPHSFFGCFVVSPHNTVVMIRPIPSETTSGHWTFPKGPPDEGEDPVAAASRESMEATGVLVEPGTIHSEVCRTVGCSVVEKMHHDTWKKHPTYPNELQRPTLCYHKQVTYYLAEVDEESPDVGPNNETIEVEWVPMKQVLKRLQHDKEKEVAIFFHGVQTGRTLSNALNRASLLHNVGRKKGSVHSTLSSDDPPAAKEEVVTVQPLSFDATFVPTTFTATYCSQYLSKYLGVVNNPRAPATPRHRILWSFVGSFLGIFVLAMLNFLVVHDVDYVTIVGSFGAHAVLVFAAPHSPLAQPWNAIVGNVVSAFVGVTCFKLVGESIPSENVETLLGTHGMNWIAAPLAVSLAITFQFVTSSLHPPGGAMALIATIAGPSVKRTGYWYVLVPGLLGSLVQVGLGIVVNNVSRDEQRRYPRQWKPAFFPNLMKKMK